jgi:hypothetical protein
MYRGEFVLTPLICIRGIEGKYFESLRRIQRELLLPGKEKLEKILSVELARDNESLSSKAHNFLIRCPIEVSFFATWRTQRDTSIKITEHVVPSFEWIHF